MPNRMDETKLNWESVKMKWDELTEQLQTQWDELTAEDVRHVGGDRERLLTKIQERYDISYDEADKEIDRWHTNHHLYGHMS
jgi:uncharacterized protein YjbJ (UPF0337 family)